MKIPSEIIFKFSLTSPAIFTHYVHKHFHSYHTKTCTPGSCYTDLSHINRWFTQSIDTRGLFLSKRGYHPLVYSWRRSIVPTRTPAPKVETCTPTTTTNQWFNWEAAVWDAGTCRDRFRERWELFVQAVARATNSAASSPLLVPMPLGCITPRMTVLRVESWLGNLLSPAHTSIEMVNTMCRIIVWFCSAIPLARFNNACFDLLRSLKNARDYVKLNHEAKID